MSSHTNRIALRARLIALIHARRRRDPVGWLQWSRGSHPAASARPAAARVRQTRAGEQLSSACGGRVSGAVRGAGRRHRRSHPHRRATKPARTRHWRAGSPAFVTTRVRLRRDGRRLDARRSAARRLIRIGRSRQPDPHADPAIRAIAELERAAVRLDDLAAQRQPEAAAGRLGRIERQQRIGEHFRRSCPSRGRAPRAAQPSRPRLDGDAHLVGRRTGFGAFLSRLISTCSSCDSSNQPGSRRQRRRRS